MGFVSNAPAITFVLSKDVGALKGFYAEVLGLPLLGEDPFAATFDLGGGTTLRLTLVPDHVPGQHTALGWRVDNLDAAIEAMKAAGVAPEIYPGLGQDDSGVWASPDGSARLVWFKDPEGNGLSLTEFIA